MYSLFLDETGYVQKYRSNPQISTNRRYFILGGLVIADNEKRNFEDAVTNIISNYFQGITLPSNFKLCYHGLRQCKKSPYDQLDKATKIRIADEMFSTIANLNCHLLSCQIDIDYIYQKYMYEIPQRVLGLSFISERFEYFLREHSDNGEIIHEFATRELNKQMQTNYGRLHLTHNLPKSVEFDHINQKINFAKVAQEPILQLSDFFVYSVLIRARTLGTKETRWRSVCSKYYNLNFPDILRKGNCSI